MGMPWKLTDIRTSSRSVISRTAAVKASHCTSGSGPDSSRKGVPVASRISSSSSRGTSYETQRSLRKVIAGRRAR
jgi:hypothetical protein